MRARILGGALAAILLAALAAPLLAHMNLVKSEPPADAALKTAPRHVQVWFSQEPDPMVSKLEMNGPAGAVKLVGFHPMPDKSLMAMVGEKLTDGRYTVSWQAAGDDGHIQKGEFAFTLNTGK